MAVPHVFCLCYVCGVATFVFLFVSVLVGGQGLVGIRAISLSFDGHSGKSRGHEISAKCPDRNTAAGILIATTAYCHWETLGNVLRTVDDNVQEPKLSVTTEGVGVGKYKSILIRRPLFSVGIAADCFQMQY